jgi:hypothetical protein
VTYTFKLSRRLARLRAPLWAATFLTVVGCSSSDTFGPGSSDTPGDAPSTNHPALATSFAGGIPIGLFAQPTEDLGSRYNGAMRTIQPDALLGELAAIKSRGGRIVLMRAGSQPNYLNADGTFSLSKWKERIDRFRGIDFSSYVKDGTIVAHYLIDEPYDPANYAGEPVPGATIDEMARYSKSIWPGMLTAVRSEPYLIKWSGTYQYLDAAWAQYAARKGDPYDYVDKNVAAAKQMGLGLIVGLNLTMGGNPNNTGMSASEVESYGNALLSSSYPCAFLSWQYDGRYLSGSGIGSAMDKLRQKAQNRATASCKDGSATDGPPPPSDPPPPPSEPPPPPAPSSLPFGLALAPATASNWSSSVYKATPSELPTRLSQAGNSQVRLIVMLAGMARVKNADGTFSLTKWKSEVDRYRTMSLGTAISNRTFYLHYLVDQPNCASCWGGRAIPWSTVDEMARYSKSIWPGLATVARAAPSDLAKATFQWAYLDAGWAQYNTRMGDIRTYVSNEVAHAKSEGLGLVAGLNVQDASGVHTAPMTASQIKAFGTVLASHPYVCALAGWKYDAAYLSQTGIRAAFDAVASVARSRTAGSCKAS